MALSRIVILSVSLLRNLDIEANKFYDRAHRLYDKLLTRCYTQHVLGILSKFNLSTRGLNSLTYPVYLKINLLSLLFPMIGDSLKIRNPPSFVVRIINLFLLLF